MSTKKLHPKHHLPEEITVAFSHILRSTVCSIPFQASHRKTLTQRLLISTYYLLQSLDPETTPSFGDTNNSSLKNLNDL
ncbi:unnamed protein product [Prunus armeniaca]|uniref:Uncharacterized protein n=1 Tax=Prunus armeniaca TaxID=36596 RepID=A0A6J5XK60_PRUAR|nr:hypothetical protein GBA52_019975 [Prunus armeniaca]CAB4283744.1 unnamed protein product [Prunus armeniaca]CAB4314230.1 unnamed protein product [Prunus armeniaca]